MSRIPHPIYVLTVKLTETFPNRNPVSVRNIFHLVFNICPILIFPCRVDFWLFTNKIKSLICFATLTTLDILIIHFRFILFHVISCSIPNFNLDYEHTLTSSPNKMYYWTINTLLVQTKRCHSSLFAVTFADVTGDAADLSVDHLLVKVFDVKRLNSEGQSPCQHGKHTHTSAYTHTHTSTHKPKV